MSTKLNTGFISFHVLSRDRRIARPCRSSRLLEGQRYSNKEPLVNRNFNLLKESLRKKSEVNSIRRDSNKGVRSKTLLRWIALPDVLQLSRSLWKACVEKWGVIPPYSAFSGERKVSFCGREMEGKGSPASGYEELVMEVEEYLNSFKNFEKMGVPKGAGTDSKEGFDLARMSRLLASLGDPLSKYQVVHVAGTKGKGSTVAFISNILRAAGFRVGSYTSPHILSLRERIVSGHTGQPIGAQEFHQLYRDLRENISQTAVDVSGTLTHFEVLTAIAFTQFARERVDIAVIETGLGGARDATNVIPASSLLASVIVAIGEDHLEALGGSLASIALAKAGIIKERRPVIIGRQPEAMVDGILRRVASLKNAPVVPKPGHEAVCIMKSVVGDYGDSHQICDIKIKNWHMKSIKLRALGSHQLDNAVSAVQTALCLREQGLRVTDSSIRLGLENTTIPGRFHVASPMEGEALGIKGATVILDGAHTESSASALADTLLRVFPECCLAFVVAMASDKDHLAFAKALLQVSKPTAMVATTVNIAGASKRALPSSTLVNILQRARRELETEIAGVNHNVADTKVQASSVVIDEAKCLADAVAKAASIVHSLRNGRIGVVCITGSLHAVSEALSLMSSY